MLRDISIKNKLIILLLGVVSGFLVLIFMMYLSISYGSDFGNIKQKIENMKSDMLMLRRNEKDFILRKDLKYKKKFLTNYNKLISNSKELDLLLQKYDFDNSKLTNFNKIVKDYKNEFFIFVQTQEIIGLNEKDALYGSLRNSVHKVQAFAKQSKNHQLLSSVYDLRKQEKDFMLRRNIKYVSKFEKKIDNLINNSNLVNTQSKEYLLSYKNDFLKLVNNEIKIGLTSKDGIQGKMRNTIHKTESLLKKLSKELNIKLHDKENRLMIMCLIFVSLIMLMTFITITIINKDISLAIKNFKMGLLNFFEYLNKSTNSIENLDDKAKDEFGLMSKIVNENIQKTKKTIEENEKLIEEVRQIAQAAKGGMIVKRVENSTLDKDLEELKQTFNEMLDVMAANVCGNMNKIQFALKEFQSLNFTHRVPNPTGKTSQGLNLLADTINDMLVENKSNGMTLDKSANTLMNNVEKLSTASTYAARSIEETSNALEQITSNISNNTKNIVTMAKYANELTSSSSKGKSLANKTTNAMNDINSEIITINEAITVIDQIAFQTNILSLNAAVEAATAGEAGKGFAVVAGEVRNLANRSSQAANQIKKIVENATTKANEGKDISEQMIQGYLELSENINNSMKLIKSIENASKEQYIAIEQINSAISQLDSQTQENAHIANTTKNIALQTQTIAQRVVDNANAKEFIGKEKVQEKEFLDNYTIKE